MTTFVCLEDYTVAPAPTFELPEDLSRKHLREGQLVKCVFKFGGKSERMWVLITHVMPEGVYAGILRNTPMFIPLVFGETLTFKWSNVICIAD